MRQQAGRFAAYTKSMAQVTHAMVVEEVWHVGLLDRALKGYDSQEGAGLSVSQDPEEWTRIAQLGGNSTYHLRKNGARFLDFQEATMDPQELQKVTDWAIEHAYVAPSEVYRLWQYDSEEEQEYYMEFNDLSALLEEVGGDVGDDLARARVLADEEGKRVTQTQGWRVLPAATERARHSRADSIFGLDFAFLFYAEDETDLEGVWWKGEEPERGCIFEGRLAGWETVEVEVGGQRGAILT